MFNFLFVATVIFALLDWIAAWKEWPKLLYVAKPATLLFLILWSFQVSGWSGGMLWFGIGLLCSLLGDIALMLSPRFFLAGLFAFLLAHVAYLVGFNQIPAPFTMGIALVAILCGWGAAQIFKRIRVGIIKTPGGKRVMIPIFLYGSMLTLMMLSAVITLHRADWTAAAAFPAAIGGVLFFVSDSLLGTDRFVKKIPHGRFLVHVTYHLGQIGLITGALTHFIK